MGAVFSQTLRKGERVVGSDDWAARGGTGSVLMRAHNVVAIIFGGKAKKKFPKEDIGSIKVTKQIVEGVHKKPMNEVILRKQSSTSIIQNLRLVGLLEGTIQQREILSPF